MIRIFKKSNDINFYMIDSSIINVINYLISKKICVIKIDNIFYKIYLRI